MIPQNVLEAFDASTEGEALEGGQNESMKYGDIAIKPIHDASYYTQVSQVFESLIPTDYRISKPIKTRDGLYVIEGYCATKYEPGYDDDKAVKEKIEVARYLNKDLEEADISCWKFSDDPWSRANDVLWRGAPLQKDWSVEIKTFIEDKLKQLLPYEDAYQLIHGDLGGNILFHEELKPLVIDFSPTIAPAKYAEAIIVCDSIAWAGQPLSCMDFLGDLEIYRPFLQRAVMFRALTVAFAEWHDDKSFFNEWKHFEKIWQLLIA